MTTNEMNVPGAQNFLRNPERILQPKWLCHCQHTAVPNTTQRQLNPFYTINVNQKTATSQ